MLTTPRPRRPSTPPTHRSACALLLVMLLQMSAGCFQIDDPTLHPPAEARFAEPPPPLRNEPPSADLNVFWGDLHIHSSYSYDAYTLGTRALPEDAYLYAKGGTIQHALGYPIRLSSPLDFAAVTDHAEYLGVPRHRAQLAGDEEFEARRVLASGNRLWITYYVLSTLRNMTSREKRHAAFGGDEYRPISIAAWNEIRATAERHNDPGRFTTFAGYEWSSMPNGENLHRNVIYRSDRAPAYPVSSLESENPEDLWQALERQREQGMEMIAIPHNANVSNGRMYDDVQWDGSQMTAAYAKTRMRNEPISEIFQIKGQSETHPVLSADDEFARFDLYDQVMSPEGPPSEPSGSYVRDAFRTGLELSAESGLNPYRFGVIGSSDSHNASSSVEEDRHHGKLPLQDGTAGLRLGASLLLPEGTMPTRFWGSAGLAAVWAEENTRDALFEAMQRKETYATSGPRITLRFFGGWDIDASLLEAPDRIARAYAGGVPMGGDLHSTGSDRAPRFMLLASKDPRGAHLDRIQIIKLWVDANGESHEKIYDAAASDGRPIDPVTHRAAAVGNTVDVPDASYSNSIGAAVLETVWADPDFDAKLEAAYYARVIEIPTPTYRAYDAKALGIPAPEPAVHQERAVSSAIWVAP